MNYEVDRIVPLPDALPGIPGGTGNPQ
jgi:hypothetical protein